jgi:hypothetical protein
MSFSLAKVASAGTVWTFRERYDFYIFATASALVFGHIYFPSTRRWSRMRQSRFGTGIGAVATGLALAVVLIAKFTEGAWPTVIVIPLVVLLLRFVRHCNDQVDRQVLAGRNQALDMSGCAALVPLER